MFSFHGGLSSRLDAAPAHRAATRLGSGSSPPDRPGIGRSTYLADRRLIDWPNDVPRSPTPSGSKSSRSWAGRAAAPTQLHAARCLVHRVRRVAMLSSAVPIDVFGTTRGLTFDDRVLLFLVHRAPAIAALLMRVMIADASPLRLYHEVLRSFPAVDRAVIKEMGPPAQAVAFVAESMRQGTDGCVQDFRIFGDPWGFALEHIGAPVDAGRAQRIGPGRPITAIS